MRAHFSSPVRVGGHLYGSSDVGGGMLVCFDLRAGELRWKQRGLGKGTVLAADGVLVLLSDRGKLSLAEATPEGYREKAQWQPFDGRTWTMPSLAGGLLYLRDEEEVICVDLRQ
jgi:hypothetical protein